MAKHHALINQSEIMSNSVQNAIYGMTMGNWTLGYIGPCYSQLEPSAAAASREAASAIEGISSRLMVPSATSAGIGSTPVPAQFSQPAVFQSVGTPVQSAPAPMTTSGTKNGRRVAADSESWGLDDIQLGCFTIASEIITTGDAPAASATSQWIAHLAIDSSADSTTPTI